MSLIGPKLFGLVKDLVSPKAPKNCTLEELITALNNHYKPQVILIYERFKFYRRCQENHENVTSFIPALKSLAATCDFGTRPEEMFRDKLVIGLREESTQRVLLTEKSLTFARAVEIAIGREAAERDVREFSSRANPTNREVNAVKASGKNHSYNKKQKPKLGGKEKGKKL